MVYLTDCSSVQRNNAPQTATILVRGHNQAVTAEAERSIHDALCVVRCLVKRPQLVVGGAAVESLVAATLEYLAPSTTGVNPHCYRAYAHAARLIPATLAENAGLPPLQLVSKLLAQHEVSRRFVIQALPFLARLREIEAARGGKAEATDEEIRLRKRVDSLRREIFEVADKGLNMDTGTVSSMRALHVLQPALVSSSMFQLATEMATQILKISDMVLCNF